MTTDRERERLKELVEDMRSCGEEGALGVKKAWFTDADLIETLMHENEELRKEIDSREVFWAELKMRLLELERENEALRGEAERWRRVSAKADNLRRGIIGE